MEHIDTAFVPSQRRYPGEEEVTLELRRTEEGQLAVLAFSSLGVLVAGCGEAQPWVAVPTERLDDLVRLSGADVVLWNVGLDEEQRHDEEGDGG